nr:hypothetical protein [Tanacetum cinerariifolium]
MLLCLVRIIRRYYLRDEVYPTFHYDDDREIDLFNLIRAPNPTKVKTGSRPRGPHEVPLQTLTTSRVIEMDEPAVATDSPGVPSAIEKSPLDFAHEDGASDQGTAAPEMPPPEDVPATAAPGVGQAEEAVAAEHPVARESHKRCHDGVLLSMSVTLICYLLSTLHHTIPLMLPTKSSQGIAAAGDPESENVSSPAEVGSPRSVYQPEWGVANGSLLDTPEACQDLVDHAAPLGYFFELRHMHNEEFLRQYNVNLAQQVATGSQLRLRFEQEAKLLRKSVAQVARRDKRIEAWELEIKNLEALLETEADMKRAAEDKSAFADVVSARVAKGMSEGLKHGVEHRQAQLTVESIEAYDLEAEAKFIAALQSLKDLNSSQLTIPVYPEVRDPRNPWAYKEEIKLSDAIAANISRAEKKKKCRIVCRTHGVGSAHHARSNGVPVSVPTVVPQALAVLLVDAATQTDFKDA